MAMCFLDCEFTDLLRPELLSIGLVELAGAEHYVELDLDTEIGKARMCASSEFVRWSGVLDQWRLVEGATATQWEMGRRTGDWLRQLAKMSGTCVEVCHDYDLDFEVMAHAVRDSGLWDQVQDAVLPTNINRFTGNIAGELAAEECFRGLATRGLRRHHALADALALRAAYVVAKSSATELARFTRTDDFRRLVNAAGGLEWESWTRQWLLKPAHGLGRRPLDIAGDPDGVALLEEHLGRIGNG